MDLSKTDNLKTIRKELDEAISKTLEKHDLIHILGKFTYEGDGSAFNVKLTVSQNLSKEEQFNTAKKKMPWIKLEYNQEFQMDGEKCNVVGLKPNARKNSILFTIEGRIGKFVCSPDDVAQALMSEEEQFNAAKKKMPWIKLKYSQEFQKNGKKCNVVGLQPNAKKNSIVFTVEGRKGKFVCDEDTVAKGLSMADLKAIAES